MWDQSRALLFVAPALLLCAPGNRRGSSPPPGDLSIALPRPQTSTAVARAPTAAASRPPLLLPTPLLPLTERPHRCGETRIVQSLFFAAPRFGIRPFASPLATGLCVVEIFLCAVSSQRNQLSVLLTTLLIDSSRRSMWNLFLEADKGRRYRSGPGEDWGQVIGQLASLTAQFEVTLQPLCQSRLWGIFPVLKFMAFFKRAAPALESCRDKRRPSSSLHGQCQKFARIMREASARGALHIKKLAFEVAIPSDNLDLSISGPELEEGLLSLSELQACVAQVSK